MSKRMAVKYCKVCHDSGKTEKEYTSHYTRENRNPNARIICPVLKALECRYCCKNGHTVKYCPVLKKNNQKQEKKVNFEKKEIKEKKENKEKANTNKFAYLDEDSEDEEEKEKDEEKEEKKDSLITVKQTIKPVFSYALALKTEQKKMEEPENKMMNPVVLEQSIKKPEYKGRILDWAAYCDSDSDDE
jgi:hypothetical protein